MEFFKNPSDTIFQAGFNFEETCLEVFQLQYGQNKVYKQYVDALGVEVSKVCRPEQIPFLPIRFFKTHKIVSTYFDAELVFESSGTTATTNSKHYVKDAAWYEKSFLTCFEQFYGKVDDWCVLGLLPSYLERGNSSLVYMVQKLVTRSTHPDSGFYLYDFEKLYQTLKRLEQEGKKTVLIGVTFALLDFAALYPLPLNNTIVMETGGMKGRKKEMIRNEVHDILKQAFSLDAIHSEYGMTELLSQAYSSGSGLYRTPDWMRIVLRDEEDPLSAKPLCGNDKTRGLINVIDLANICSCSFIATDDLGVLYSNGTFEVTGRMDNSDLRGCSLLAL